MSCNDLKSGYNPSKKGLLTFHHHLDTKKDDSDYCCIIIDMD